MKHLIAALCLLASPALATPGPQSWGGTIPPGTLWGNPLQWAGVQGPQSQAYANIGHLALIKAASMTSTSDQPMTMLMWSMPAKYQITSIYVSNCSTTPAGAVGGIYTAASKGGTAIVAAGQTYAALTTTTAIEALTNNVATAAQTSLQFYFSLTTAASSGTPTCDVFVDGIGMQ